jgi:hypothetical protein
LRAAVFFLADAAVDVFFAAVAVFFFAGALFAAGFTLRRADFKS